MFRAVTPYITRNLGFKSIEVCKKDLILSFFPPQPIWPAGGLEAIYLIDIMQYLYCYLLYSLIQLHLSVFVCVHVFTGPLF